MYRSHRWVVVVSGIVVFLSTTILAVWLYKIKELSANGRVLMWKMQINTILENPMGVGREFFQGAIAKSQEEYFRTNDRGWGEQLVAGAPEDSFNELLQIGVEQGVLECWHSQLYLLLRYGC